MEEADEQLMRRVTTGDMAAFDTLLLRHQSAVFRFATRMVGDSSLAEDLTQECFLRVWRARRDYRPTAAFRTWLFTILRRLVLDEAKRLRVATGPLDEVDRGLSQAALPPAMRAWLLAACPEEQLLSQELRRTIGAALEALPAELREVFLLRELEALPYDQIAAIIGCPVGTVKSRLNTARARLRAAVLQWIEAE